MNDNKSKARDEIILQEVVIRRQRTFPSRNGINSLECFSSLKVLVFCSLSLFYIIFPLQQLRCFFFFFLVFGIIFFSPFIFSNTRWFLSLSSFLHQQHNLLLPEELFCLTSTVSNFPNKMNIFSAKTVFFSLFRIISTDENYTMF